MRKAAILNNYLSTFGGGEKNTYAIANTLVRSGYDVEVITFEDRAPDPEDVSRFFGPGHDGFRILTLGEPGLSVRERDDRLRRHLRQHDAFFNQSNSSTFVNPCPLGVYVVMFPFQEPGPWLASYRHFLCNSHYTQSYVQRRWGTYFWGEQLATHVLYPSVDELPVEPDEPRAREVLAIGRFTWEGHAKNQDLLAHAFAEMIDRLPGWTLTLLGKVHGDPVTKERMDRLREDCRDVPVRFELNATLGEKRAALRRAAVLWHATGLGLDEPRDAAKMEHFGIAVVEAMISGAIPMCYHRGGPREIVRHGETGFLYRDVRELAAFSEYVAHSPAAEHRLRRAAVQRARLFSRDRFDAALRDFMATVAPA